ncbi:MAG: hypothetical protein KIT86_19665 [Hydrogenophaga sp.]|uniref:hypothetical protein n=1 Tax=Hydrogenophaga sp. TaxID=1904254 RepID=UPI00262944B3|nr:hypothetical protein [Hydrogenophaga sp.]MCW5671881.1 hypothetical protein [Hydrogenophaga sp.]
MQFPAPTPSVQHPVAVSMPDLLSPGLAKSLAEAGFLAIDQKRWPQAEQIFSVLRAFRRQSEFPYVGLSLIDLLQGRREAAAQWAKEGLDKAPGSRALAELLEKAVQGGAKW